MTAYSMNMSRWSHSVPRQLALAVAVTATADWLFYGHTIGISLALFLVVLLGCTALANTTDVSWRTRLLVAGGLVVALAPSVESVNPASFICGVAGATWIAAMIVAPHQTSLRDRLWATRCFLVTGPFRLFPDLGRTGHWTAATGMLVVWIMPVVLGGVFLALFASANPMIEQWLGSIELGRGMSRISLSRVIFWFAALSVVWPFIHAKISRPERSPPDALLQEAATDKTADDGARFEDVTIVPSEIFGTAAIFRSLVMFNLLFAVQTGLDALYLWGGVSLPDSMTYATYAHRGAYPLIVTALLAAGFILSVTNDDQASKQTRMVRFLIILWATQNLILVLSSILRLDRYIEAYSLTYLRVAAFIWMLLVALGLILIVARLLLRRSNVWLIRINTVTLAGALYICMFVNFPALVANYNVTDSREMDGNGPSLDLEYLVSLGPQAIPALDHLVAHHWQDPAPWLANYRSRLALRHRRKLDSWQGWTLSDMRLQHYLERTDANAVALQKGDVSATPAETAP
jgi:hypothetical protein